MQYSLPVCFDSQSTAPLMRQALEELGYGFERSAGSKLVTRMVVVVPIPTNCYVFRFTVTAKGKAKAALDDKSKPPIAADSDAAFGSAESSAVERQHKEKEAEMRPLYIDIYDKRLTQTAFIPIMEISGYDESRESMKEILSKFIEKFPRKPWEFTFAQKSAIGLLNGDVLRAKGDWARALG